MFVDRTGRCIPAHYLTKPKDFQMSLSVAWQWLKEEQEVIQMMEMSSDQSGHCRQQSNLRIP